MIEEVYGVTDSSKKDLRNGMRQNYGTGDVPRTILQFRHNNVKPTTFGWQGDGCSEDLNSL